MCHKYGAFFPVRFGSMKVLVVADHAAVTAILKDRPGGFRRPLRTVQVALEMGGNLGLFQAEGDDWRKQRRLVMSALAPTAVKAYFPTLLKVAGRLRKRWEAAARQQVVIDLSADLKRYTVDVIAGLAFGTDVNTLESGEDVIQQHLDIVLPAVARRTFTPFPYWRYIRLPIDRQLDRSVVALRSAIGDLILQARARLDADQARESAPRNLLEAMLIEAAKPDSGLDDTAVLGNVTTMLLAGEDTTANTLGWMLYLMQKNPAQMQLAQEEVRRVAPDARAFTIEQLDALYFLDACAQEALRLKPVAPFMPLEALRDTVVADIAVPAGTLVWCVMRHDTMRDVYFPDAEQFLPQRWLGDESSADADASVVSGDKRISIPFGAGPRTCPGRYLALLEIKIAMALLLGHFEIDSVGTADGSEVQETMDFVMAPAGLQMRLRLRD